MGMNCSFCASAGAAGHAADSTTDDARWECVDVKAVAPFPRPVTLAEIKDEPRLSELALVRQSRLSVVPVAEAEWRLICEMGGYEG